MEYTEVTNERISNLLRDEEQIGSREFVHTIFFMHLVVDKYLCCFHLLAIVSSAAMNMCVQVFVNLFSIVLVYI